MAHARTYVTPRALLNGQLASKAVAEGLAWPFAAGSGSLAFAIAEISTRGDGPMRTALLTRAQYESNPDRIEKAGGKVATLLQSLGQAPSKFAGIDLAQPVLMGVVNVTPDSFSDGGAFQESGSAIERGLSLWRAGAAIVDVGGESTRPGAAPITTETEIARVVPVVRNLVSQGVCVSIDTRHAGVMVAAIEAGARIVNDVTALAGDPNSLQVVADSGVAVILMHMQGEPQTMQDNPIYDWAPGDVFDFLDSRIAACIDAGVAGNNIALDPGIGFGKTVSHNAEIMDHLALFHGLGCPLAVGASRKSFIARMSNGEAADERLPGSLAAGIHAVGQGAHILRVHDVVETRQALSIVDKLSQNN